MVKHHLAFLALGLLSACNTSSQSPTKDPIATTLSQISNRGPNYTLFESGQVRPIALSPNKRILFAANTPDNKLEIYDVNDSNRALTHRASVSVGLEPVAVAVRSDSEVWVVNHLSDSVSIVRLDRGRPRVVRTLLVGDEPRDIVFGGSDRSRAFITTAHRGQNRPGDPQLSTPGVGRADVWVFDANSLGDSLGGDPLTIVTLFTDTPRALAVSPDGSRVYAAGFHTGNKTTTLNETATPDGGEAAGGVPGPNVNYAGQPQPETGVIVKWNGSHWIDQAGKTWDSSIKYSLPDKDVFVLDANANPPVQLSGAAGFYAEVGSVLFNMIANPVSGKVYVSNTDANNFDRFEGPGTFTGHSLRGHLHESRISVLGPSGVVSRHLNKHINYDTCCSAIPNSVNARSLSQPVDMAITGDGSTLYVAAFGSSKIGVFQTAQLENNSFVPGTANQINVSGGGPSGLALDESNHRLYVLTRFDNAISVVDTRTGVEQRHLAMNNPEPASVTRGRRFLYDASYTSSNGESACGSCHVFGDFDSLAWNLGNPDGDALANPSRLREFPGIPNGDPAFRPLKGPMVTQSLRGMDNHGPMHWRGDRTGVNDEATAQPNSGQFNETLAFSKFNPAFEGLLGRSAPLSASEMAAFGDFILQATYPPNPIRNLDNSLTADQAAGREHFFSEGVFFGVSCNSCHVLDLNGNREFGVRRPGFFGTQGELVVETVDFVRPQAIKIPHLRNIYQKVGRFGQGRALPPFTDFVGGSDEHLGDQVRGIGLMHDGTFDTVFRFMQGLAFSQVLSPHGFLFGPAGDPQRRQVEAFVMAFDSNMAPIVGQQVTLTATNWNVASPRISLLMNRAAAGECDLVAKANFGGDEAGFLYDNSTGFITDRRGQRSISLGYLRARAAHTDSAVTFTCTPPGSGVRIALDCNGNSRFDGDERDERGDGQCACRGDD
ncbi:MAG TPA: hypothetical protein PKI03_15630 [Pseudomonadota bacterium]|nr:hypothetical protein [Pseudomonadota bacterium]